jgi:hypothetical protein
MLSMDDLITLCIRHGKGLNRLLQSMHQLLDAYSFVILVIFVIRIT